ncbi:MAG: hypothetical protein FWE15_14280 [Actinomycetia bacterium]|nr:hypothetical protein [Actinomycetes bacterium]
MTEGVGHGQARVVAEFGPGTGIFTHAVPFTVELASRLDRLERSKAVWTNLPPAFVHGATRRP